LITCTGTSPGLIQGTEVDPLLPISSPGAEADVPDGRAGEEAEETATLADGDGVTGSAKLGKTDGSTVEVGADCSLLELVDAGVAEADLEHVYVASAKW